MPANLYAVWRRGRRLMIVVLGVLLLVGAVPGAEADMPSSPPAALTASAGRLAVGFAGYPSKWVEVLVVEPFGSVQAGSYKGVDLSKPWAMIVVGHEKGTSGGTGSVIDCQNILNIDATPATERPHPVLSCDGQEYHVTFGHYYPVGGPQDLSWYHDRVEKGSFPYTPIKGHTFEGASWADVGLPIEAASPDAVEYVVAGRGPSMPYLEVCEPGAESYLRHCYAGGGNFYRTTYVQVYDSVTSLSLVLRPGT